ncbi:adenylate/guanylate cyclase domain-containing protein [uncultured Winogradskyella sp.]|uniref:adenylate/guanylate cyclase domain-containing protein n=2 Tax=Winogradskyella TaxID=286104 RepID=UPI0030DAA92A|tara:strand:+ start:3578 stop:5530 length:1953 start_codon:yes stop_codon:yes gene_type:complete
MKYLFCIFIGFGCFLNITAQDSDYFEIWEDKTQTDSTRAKAYYTYLFIEYMFDKPDSALVLVENLKDFAESKNDLYSLGLSQDLTARSYYYNSDYDNALKHINISLKTFEKHGDQLKISQALSLIGEIYSDQGNYIKALDYIKRSAKIAEEIDNKIQTIFTINLIGNIYLNQEDDDNALIYYQQSLALTEGDKGSLDYANALYNIGGIFLKKKDYNKSLDYYNKSETIYKELGEQVGLSNILYEKGNVYTEQEKFTIALEFYKESLKVDEEFEIYYNAMIKFLGIGQLYVRMERYKEAKINCLKSLSLAEEFGALSIEEESCECLYYAYKGIGNTKKTLTFIERFSILKEELKEDETAVKLQQMEFAKQVEADSLKQVEIDLREEIITNKIISKKDTNKNIAIGVGAIFLILAGGFYWRYRYTKKSKNVIEKEKERSDNLLLNILPAEIAEELKIKGKADAKGFNLASILFTDFKGFTQASEKLSPVELIEEINECFKAFDYICEKYNMEKIKTIGDAYMAAGGLPIPSDASVKKTVLGALEMQDFISNRIEEKKAKNEIYFEMRLGIHTGPVVAGIVGVKKFQYDIWGDTVNTAARMESSGDVGRVNISETTYNLIKNDNYFAFQHRGKIEAKGKGEIEMYFVDKAKPN